MSDKIKVWKCEACLSGEHPCIAVNIAMGGYFNKPLKCIGECDEANWQPTTDYEITEKIPTTPDEIEKKYGTIWGKRSRATGQPVKVINITPTKKRLKIKWDEITADNVYIAHILSDRVNPIDTEKIGTIRTNKGELQVSDIPPTWLEDVIEPGPMSAEDVVTRVRKEQFPDHLIDTISYMGISTALVKAGEQNERLRHQPKQTFEEWYDSLTLGQNNNMGWEGIWQASEKNRGHE